MYLCIKCKRYTANFLYNGSSYCSRCLRELQELELQNKLISKKGKKYGKKKED